MKILFLLQILNDFIFFLSKDNDCALGLSLFVRSNALQLINIRWECWIMIKMFMVLQPHNGKTFHNGGISHGTTLTATITHHSNLLLHISIQIMNIIKLKTYHRLNTQYFWLWNIEILAFKNEDIHKTDNMYWCWPNKYLW